MRVRTRLTGLRSAAPAPQSVTDTPDPTQPNTGTFHDVLASYGPLIKRAGSSTLLVLNSGLTPDDADALIAAGQIDAAAFGRAWINNPDLQRRVEAGVPLTTDMDWAGLYSFAPNPAKGYSDYPTAT
jgi:2,4-dienoyl-CoA reductase-like NADH-dependent reductase (Old Yellow Enzyme family)